MSLCEEILSKCFKIANYEITGIEESGTRIILDLSRVGESYCHCASPSKRYDSTVQEFLIGSLNMLPIYARVRIWRINCEVHGIVTERHGINTGKKRHSVAVENAVLRYTEKLDNKAAAELFGVSAMQIYRIDCEGLKQLEQRYLNDLPQTDCLSVDEAAYKRQHNYATIISDYKAGKVLWLEKNRKQEDLVRGYNVLGDSLEHVESVSMDLWRAFENATTQCLPKAKVVYDRFHIARLLNRAIEKERRDYQKNLPDNERKVMKKHSRWVLLKRSSNLTLKNQNHLADLKQVNKPLYEIYLLKEAFLDIFDPHLSQKNARRQIFTWIREIYQTNYENLKRFAKSILKRMRNILNWFKNPISNGKAEGINNVIKTLLKRAYGYKNFDYFRLKVLQKCGYLMKYAYPQFLL